MKRKLLILILMVFGSANCFSQNNFDPRVLILSPNRVTVDKKSKKLLDIYQTNCVQPIIDYYKNSADSLIQIISEDDSLKDNFKVHYINQIRNADSLDYSSIFSFNDASSTQQFLSMDLPNVLVEYSGMKSNGDIQSLIKIADSSNANYIINIPDIEYYYYKNSIIAKPRFQLYDCIAHEILIDNSGELNELGNSFNKCETSDGTILIRHSGIMEYSILLNTIKSSKSQSERCLEQWRIEILDSLYTFDKASKSIEKILIDNIPDINIESYYKGIYNNSRTKFIAFFTNESPTTWSKQDSFYELIIYSGKLEDENWIIEKEIEGVNVIGKKNKLSSMKRHFFINLRRIDYFEEGSTVFNQEFWDEELYKNNKTVGLIH